MSDIPRLNYKQYRRVRKLVHQCCNYDDGYCLPLYDVEPCVCPQSISYSLNCKWFREAVLPTDDELYREFYPTFGSKEKRCKDCGKTFRAPTHNTLYCPDCASKRARRSKREWAKRMRSSVEKVQSANPRK